MSVMGENFEEIFFKTTCRGAAPPSARQVNYTFSRDSGQAGHAALPQGRAWN
ncbi:hypothetical protein [Segatella copri]|uniref:Uncharacterized protein n=1 Tax=Segatella copri TaxID=165179 RepID=A0AAW5TZW1_9BACT|nr:hypothetical protein [Segatella copri]MCW4094338.1 hypothetical protein [Segatella copri]